MAFGLGLIYGVLRIVNLAHGGVIMAGAYAGWWLYETVGLDPYLSLIPVAAAAFLFGVVIYRLLVRRLPRGAAGGGPSLLRLVGRWRPPRRDSLSLQPELRLGGAPQVVRGGGPGRPGKHRRYRHRRAHPGDGGDLLHPHPRLPCLSHRGGGLRAPRARPRAAARWLVRPARARMTVSPREPAAAKPRVPRGPVLPWVSRQALVGLVVVVALAAAWPAPLHPSAYQKNLVTLT